MESREQQVRDFEALAEWLVAEQLDLLAQVEAQLRAVHHTMRRIATLRNKEHRRGMDEPTDHQRKQALNGLTDEIQRLDDHVTTQVECCQAMLETVGKMQRRLRQMKQAGSIALDSADSASSSDATD
jgi:hypothetical protein